MTSRRSIWVIGLGQLVNWGVLYYAFGVLLVPVAAALATPRWLVAGAFSLGLLMSAAAAPLAGRLADRGLGPAVMQAGGYIAAGLLVLWALVPALWSTYLVWLGLGACMAAILYEPVFAMVGRAFSDADARLRAIATITVMGGLASTAFLPGTSFLVDAFGWRAAVATLAGVLALSTAVVGRMSFRDRPWSSADIRRALFADAPPTRPDEAAGLGRLVATFAVSGVVNSAVAANIVAALIDRRLSPAAAAAIGGLFGVMQLPGRVLMTHPSFTPGPVTLLRVSFGLQIAGLLALTIEDVRPLVVIGVLVFASGAGLTTLARPYLVLHAYGPERAGRINGVVARGQQLARAAGPVSAAALAGVAGYPVVFAGLAALLIGAMFVGPQRSVT